MSRVTSSPHRSAVLDHVDWSTYSRLSRFFHEEPGVRLTYYRGKLEIMAALTLEHEDDAGFLGRMVEVMTEEFELSIKGGKSTTLRHRLAEAGLEPDECFWIANAPRMQGRRRVNLKRDPPPDLAIEVDVSHSPMNRLGIYAALRVPEVWRLKKNVLKFYVLGEGATYAEADHSRSFPQVKPGDLMGFLQQAQAAANQNVVVRDFRKWLASKFGTK